MRAKKTETGLNLLEDGSLEVAQKFRDEMEEILAERKAIENIIESVMQSMAPLSRGCVQRERAWWRKVFVEYGISGKYLYSHDKGTVARDKDNE